MRQLTNSSYVQVMACHLGAKPLPDPIITYSKMDPSEEPIVKFESSHNNFHPRRRIRKCRP